MAEKFIKIIQDGRSSLVPDTKATRTFWAKQNAKLAGSQNASKEIVDIVEPDEEDLAFLKQPLQSTKTAAAPDDILELRKQLAQQQELINKLLIGQDDGAKDEVKEKGKPGPKPKTEQ